MRSSLVLDILQSVPVFDVVAGASAFPTDLREASTLDRLRSWQWWRQMMLPGIFPYHVTGALTAFGGSWNASIVAEFASWRDTKLKADGLGSSIAQATEAGEYPKGGARHRHHVDARHCPQPSALRPLYRLAELRFRLD